MSRFTHLLILILFSYAIVPFSSLETSEISSNDPESTKLNQVEALYTNSNTDEISEKSSLGDHEFTNRGSVGGGRGGGGGRSSGSFSGSRSSTSSHGSSGSKPSSSVASSSSSHTSSSTSSSSGSSWSWSWPWSRSTSNSGAKNSTKPSDEGKKKKEAIEFHGEFSEDENNISESIQDTNLPAYSNSESIKTFEERSEQRIWILIMVIISIFVAYKYRNIYKSKNQALKSDEKKANIEEIELVLMR